MNAENSGHSGVWTVGEANDFNNQYFKVYLEWLSDSDYKAFKQMQMFPNEKSTGFGRSQYLLEA